MYSTTDPWVQKWRIYQQLLLRRDGPALPALLRTIAPITAIPPKPKTEAPRA